MLVTHLYVYPIKSLGGVSLKSALVTDRGLQYDRRWMLVDKNQKFISQREFSRLALLQAEITDNYLVIHDKKGVHSPLLVPCQQEKQEVLTVEVWQDFCQALYAGDAAAAWFSDLLSISCCLVYMPDRSIRRVDPAYAQNGEITNFSDGYPFMMLGEASLADLNSRLDEPVPMNRFRPNIVFSGGDAYEEDFFGEFSIGTVKFFGVKRCARCVITTIDQETSSRGKEPLRTLAGYRTQNNNVYFGQNLVHQGEGTISVGDQLNVVKFTNKTLS